MNRYYSQFVNDFHVRDNVLWMDDKQVKKNIEHKAINNRLHYYHHGKSNIFKAAKDIWFPYIHRNIAAMAENCRESAVAGKNLKTMRSKRDLGTIPEPKEPSQSLQIDFWGPIHYLKESKKDVILAVDQFSRGPSAMVCGNNHSDKILKFLKAYINNHGVPRKIHVYSGTNFMSKDVKAYCNSEEIEVIQSPVNDHRNTRCVERTNRSLKNSILTYVHKEKTELLKKMLQRAFGALRLSNNATLKITPFKAHHGREANKVVGNLTKKPSLRKLNCSNVIKSKSTSLDKRDPAAREIPSTVNTNWGSDGFRVREQKAQSSSALD